MCRAPSPYSPPIPKPALTTVGKTRIATAWFASSRDDQISLKNAARVARTLASISGPEAALHRGAEHSVASSATTSARPAVRLLVPTRITCPSGLVELQLGAST